MFPFGIQYAEPVVVPNPQPFESQTFFLMACIDSPIKP